MTLKNYQALHTSPQLNYVASVGDDTFGVATNQYFTIPKEHKTIVDLLESEGVSWGPYEEDMPFSGYQVDYPLPGYGERRYMRRHK